MNPLVKLSSRIAIFSLAIVVLQVSVMQLYWGLEFNLISGAIIALASLLGIYETVLASLIFTIATTMLSYDSSVSWIYIIIAIIASKINPSSIADKFLVAIIYCFLFSPLMAFFDPSSKAYLIKLLNYSFTTVITMIPCFFIIKMNLDRIKELNFAIKQNRKSFKL